MFPYSVLSFWKELVCFSRLSKGKGRICLLLKSFLDMEVVRSDISKKSLKGPYREDVPALLCVHKCHLAPCLEGCKQSQKGNASQRFLSDPPILFIYLCRENYKGSNKAVEGVMYGVAEEDLSLFCPRRVEPYWPPTAWTEKCPAVLLPLHRLAHSRIYWWRRQYLDVSLSTLSTRTGRKGIAATSNVNLL